MSELPVAPEAAPVVAELHRDAWTRYRTKLGKTLLDRRRFWADPKRELVGFNELRGGEITSRRRFWRLFRKRGVPPHLAVWEALGLSDGPIPELEDQEAFRAYWTDAVLQEIAARWSTSRLTQQCAAEPVKTAIGKMEDAGPDFADTIITTARDPNAKDSDRIKAAKIGLEVLGIKIDPKARPPEVSPFLLTGNESPEQLEQMLLQIAQKEPDANRARLLSENIIRILEAKMPDVWGKRLRVENSGHVGLGMILAEMDAKRATAITAEPVREALPAATEADDE